MIKLFIKLLNVHFTLWCILILTLFLHHNTFVYWQQDWNSQENICLACWATPGGLQGFIRFVEWVLSEIQKAKSTSHDLRNFTTPEWLFTEWWFEINDWELTESWSKKDAKNAPQKLYRGIKRSFQQRMQTLWTTMNIMTKIVTMNPWLSFLIIFKSQPVIRDWKKLSKLENQILDTMVDLGAAWANKAKLSKEHTLKIEKLMANYTQSVNLFDMNKSYIKSNAKYSQLLKLLRTMVGKYKYFIWLNNINKLRKKSDVKKISKWKIAFYLQNEHIVNLADSYWCTSILWQCSDNFIKFKQSMIALWKDWWSSVSQSLNQMRSAVVRLNKALQWAWNRKRKKSNKCKRRRNNNLKVYERRKKEWGWWEKTLLRQIKPKNWWKPYREKQIWDGQAMQISETEAFDTCEFTTFAMWLDDNANKDTKEFLQREKELLSTQYGNQIKDARLDKSIRWQVTNFSQWSNNKKSKNNVMDNVAKWLTQQTQNQSEKKSISQQIINDNIEIDIQSLDNIDKLEKKLYTSISSTIDSHQKSLGKSTKADVRPIMKTLATTVQKVRYNTRLAGDKSFKKSIVNNLWKACDWQCNNLWWKCRSD